MGQVEIMERLYYLPDTKAVDLTIILDLTQQSVTNALRRLKKHRFVKMNTSYEYCLTPKGVDYVERYFL